MGLLNRIFRSLLSGRGITLTTEIRTERIQVQDPQTGQVRVYHSLEEVPPDIRQKIEEMRRQAARSASETKITVTDASGTTRTYRSVNEMPPEIREIYERSRGT